MRGTPGHGVTNIDFGGDDALNRYVWPRAQSGFWSAVVDQHEIAALLYLLLLAQQIHHLLSGVMLWLECKSAAWWMVIVQTSCSVAMRLTVFCWSPLWALAICYELKTLNRQFHLASKTRTTCSNNLVAQLDQSYPGVPVGLTAPSVRMAVRSGWISR